MIDTVAVFEAITRSVAGGGCGIEVERSLRRLRQAIGRMNVGCDGIIQHDVRRARRVHIVTLAVTSTISGE